MTENAQLVVTLSCPDRPGIVHAVTGVIGGAGGNVIQSQQFGDPDTGTFFMRVEVDSPEGRAPIDEGLAVVAEEFDATYRADVPAFVPVGAIRPRLGRASSGILGEGQVIQA